jgi:hypothetical protein
MIGALCAPTETPIRRPCRHAVAVKHRWRWARERTTCRYLIPTPLIDRYYDPMLWRVPWPLGSRRFGERVSVL